MKKARAGFGFIEILIAMAIVAFLAYTVFKMYFKEAAAPVIGKEEQKIISEQGIDTVNYRTTVDSTRQKLKEIQNSRPAQ
jgi:prepilin-type N-terminal cleavage/methylation domain-containing protein